MLLSLIYASRIARPTVEDPDRTLADIQREGMPRNHDQHITGLLIAHNGWFLAGDQKGWRMRARCAAFMGRSSTTVATPPFKLLAKSRSPRASSAGGTSPCGCCRQMRDAAALIALDVRKAFDPAADHHRVIMRLLTVIAEAHCDKFDRQQRRAAA